MHQAVRWEGNKREKLEPPCHQGRMLYTGPWPNIEARRDSQEPSTQEPSSQDPSENRLHRRCTHTCENVYCCCTHVGKRAEKQTCGLSSKRPRKIERAVVAFTTCQSSPRYLDVDRQATLYSHVAHDTSEGDAALVAMPSTTYSMEGFRMRLWSMKRQQHRFSVERDGAHVRSSRKHQPGGLGAPRTGHPSPVPRRRATARKPASSSQRRCPPSSPPPSHRCWKTPPARASPSNSPLRPVPSSTTMSPPLLPPQD